MTTGRINQVYASPQGCTTRSTHVHACCKLHKPLWHFTKYSDLRSATLRFHATLPTIKTYTMTPLVRTSRHWKMLWKALPDSGTACRTCSAQRFSQRFVCITESAQRVQKLILRHPLLRRPVDQEHISWRCNGTQQSATTCKHQGEWLKSSIETLILNESSVETLILNKSSIWLNKHWTNPVERLHTERTQHMTT